MPTHVLTLVCDLRIPSSTSRKDRRAVVRSIVDGARNRYRVAAAETDHHDRIQRAEVSFAVVSGSPAQARSVIDEVERFVWSFTEIEVLATERFWTDTA